MSLLSTLFLSPFYPIIPSTRTILVHEVLFMVYWNGVLNYTLRHTTSIQTKWGILCSTCWNSFVLVLRFGRFFNTINAASDAIFMIYLDYASKILHSPLFIGNVLSYSDELFSLLWLTVHYISVIFLSKHKNFGLSGTCTTDTFLDE